MKKSIAIALALLLAAFVAQGYAMPTGEETVDAAEAAADVAEAGQPKAGYCPVTLVKGDYWDCARCHVERPAAGMGWPLKESSPTAKYDPPAGVRVLYRAGEFVGYILLDSIAAHYINNAFEYLNWHPEITKVIIEVQSPGGAVFEAWRIVGIIVGWHDRFEIETQIKGMAFSAGFLIFQAGEVRAAAPHAELMWHEVRSWVMFDEKTPSKLSDEADVYRHLQDNAHRWILERVGGVDKKELDELVNKKEYWLTGSDALEVGFVDKLLWESK